MHEENEKIVLFSCQVAVRLYYIVGLFYGKLVLLLYNLLLQVLTRNLVAGYIRFYLIRIVNQLLRMYSALFLKSRNKKYLFLVCIGWIIVDECVVLLQV